MGLRVQSISKGRIESNVKNRRKKTMKQRKLHKGQIYLTVYLIVILIGLIALNELINLVFE